MTDSGHISVSPEETVFGEFEYTLNNAKFLTLTAFSMTISNKDYVLTDIFIDQPFGTNTVLIGDNGAANGQSPTGGTNDFWVFFNYSTNTVSGLSYTVAEDNGLWNAGTHTTTVSSVPAPAAVWLFGSGLLGLVGMARRKKVV